eukprot:COSAG02_NODE_14423_length_1269_cov_1.440000_1_plen_273_part_00
MQWTAAILFVVSNAYLSPATAATDIGGTEGGVPQTAVVSDAAWLRSPERAVEECQPYSVKFFLAGDHTYITVPLCTDEVSTPAVPALDKCGNCSSDQRTATASINWNQKYCGYPEGYTHLCFNSTKNTNTPIGPQEGLQMHPKCAWSLLRLLNETYRLPYRHSGGLDAALRAMYPSEIENPENWAKLVAAYAEGGQGAAMAAAARFVDWGRHLSSDCKGARNRSEVLSRNTTGSVCWNFVEDFRDLYCSYKNSSVPFDMNNAAACTRVFPSI